MDTHQDDEWVSKTAKKKQMNELQDLGMELTRLSHDTLKKIGLPEELAEAVREYRKITSNGALKRQSQFIGRLMRDIDPAPIRLLADDNALTAFIAEHPAADAGVLRTLIRNTRKEQEQAKPPKNFRALYQELKRLMQPESAVEAENDDQES